MLDPESVHAMHRAWHEHGLYRSSWRGYQMLKYPTDQTVYAEIIAETKPEVIIECLVGATRVNPPAGSLVGATRRPYEGVVVRIRTRAGHDLTATPNHPVRTPNGWVAAGLLREGDDVLGGINRERVSLGNPDVKHGPSTIAEVFDALGRAREPQRIGLTGVNFHGDASDGYVDVVPAAGYLERDVLAAFRQPTRERRFARANLREPSLATLGASGEPAFGRGLATPGRREVSGPPLAFFRREPRPRQGNRFLRRTKWVARALNRPHHPLLVHSNGNGDGFGGLSIDVAPDRIVSVERYQYTGHVYNLVTRSGFFDAEGIIVHNCGTHIGGSALFFADLIDLNGLQSQPRVYTFDTQHRTGRPADHRILYVETSSTDPEAVAAVKEMIGGRRAMVVLDSSHEPDHVFDEMLTWAPIVAPGCYLVVEDTETDIVLPQWGRGPSDAIARFFDRGDPVQHGQRSYFSIDRSRERYGITCAPGGWLRRNHRP